MYTKSKGIYKKKATKFNEGFLGGSVVKNLLANAGDMGWIPRLGKPLEKEMAPTAVFFPWKSHGLRNFASCHQVGHD